jgi:hypothetical protein
MSPYAFQNRFCDPVQRHTFVNRVSLHRLIRHAVDDAGSLILGECVRTTIVHLLHAVGAIITHTGHDYADRVWSGVARRRPE